MGAHLRRYRIWKWEWKFKCSYSSMPRTTSISCLTQENLSFRPATPRTCPSPGSFNTVHCCLTYKEDEESAFNPRIKDYSPEDDILTHHLPSISEEDKDDAEEHFPTVSLDDNVWMEEPVPERHLYIHENSQHDLCPYPCLYSLNPLHVTQEDAP